MLIQRYVFAHIIKAFFAALAVLCGVMLIVQWMQIGRYLTARDIGLVFLAMVPMGRYVIPMALLFGILFVFERLSADSEIIAMKACGVHERTLAGPVLLFASICLFINLLTATTWGPQSMKIIQERLLAEAPNRIYSFLKEREFDTSFRGMTVYVESVNPAKKRIEHIYIESANKERSVITAERGSIDVNGAQVMMRLFNGSLFWDTKEKLNYVTFDEYDFALNINLNRQLGIKGWEGATQKELAAMIKENPSAKAIKEYHNRYAFPLLNIILGLVGIAFGIQKPRSPKYTGFIVGVSTIFGYYLVFILSARLVKGEILNPILGAWLPNILFCLFLSGIWIWRRSHFSEV